MKKILLLFILTTCTLLSFGQSLKKYTISNTGCSVYMFCDPGEFELSYSEDTARIFTAECTTDSITFSVILVELKDSTTTLKDGEDLLVAYLDYLKTAYKISSAVGYGKGNRLRENANTIGVIDFWKGDDAANWKVKAWTNKKFIAVLMCYSKLELPDTKVNVFLEGVKFKGM